jgi:DNA invertase Pin-like site-specific DNA recombinase
MQYVVYLRVSTQRQGRSGLGLEAQRSAVNDYLARVSERYKRGSVLAEFVEVESGKHDDRPELAKAMRRCRLTGAVLLVAKLDRLSRNKAFLLSLMESKVRFICADMPEANEMTLSFMAVLADYERKAISDRTRAALQAAKARGVVLGNPANLTNRDTTAATAAWLRQSNERKAEMTDVIRELQDEHGPLSLRQTAKLLNDGGYTTARGKTWHAGTVRRVLLSIEQQERAREAA